MFSADERLENLANGKEISTVSFGMEKDFEWIFRKIGVLTIWPKNPEISVENEMERKFLWKIRSEIESSFSFRKGTAEIALPFAKLSSFQTLISWQQLREIELQMLSAISFGWFADFGKTFTIIHRSSQPVYSDKW